MLRRVASVLVAALAALPLLPGGSEPAGARRFQLVRLTLPTHRAGGPAPGSARDCPDPTTCPIFRLSGLRWPTDSSGRVVMTYRYSDTGRPGRAPDAATVRAALRAAAAEWHRWNSNVTFVDGGLTAARPGSPGPRGSCADGVNAVGWRAMSPAVIGVTDICFDPRTRRIQEVDTALNSVLRWGVFPAPDPAARAFDVQAILTHELGHWLSLDDLAGLRARLLTMYGAGRPGSPGQRTLGLGDILGAQAAYPCGPGDTCPRSPIARD